MTTDTATVDTSPVMRCYAVLGIGTLTAALPFPLIAALGSFLLLAGTIWAYRIRKVTSEGGLFYNHGRWMVRTFWMATLYTCVAALLYTSVISANADKSAIEGMADALKAGQSSGVDIARMIAEYQETNKILIMVTSLACFGPVLLFAMARFFMGYRKADQGQAMDNVTSWLIR